MATPKRREGAVRLPFACSYQVISPTPFCHSNDRHLGIRHLTSFTPNILTEVKFDSKLTVSNICYTRNTIFTVTREARVKGKH